MQLYAYNMWQCLRKEEISSKTKKKIELSYP